VDRERIWRDDGTRIEASVHGFRSVGVRNGL
jgi:hypothetical protein